MLATVQTYNRHKKVKKLEDAKINFFFLCVVDVEAKDIFIEKEEGEKGLMWVLSACIYIFFRVSRSRCTSTDTTLVIAAAANRPFRLLFINEGI